MGTDKKTTKVTNDNDKPHPMNKKQEKEYREQKGSSKDSDDKDNKKPKHPTEHNLKVK